MKRLFTYLKIYSLGLAGIFLLINITDVSSLKIGLYDPEVDPVKILDSTNFYHTVGNKPYVWLIEFYNQWCGTCVDFVPKWLDLAEKLRDWDSILRLGVVNCVTNRYLCTSQNTLQTPNVVYYEPELPNKFSGKDLRITGLSTTSEMIHAIINRLAKDASYFQIDPSSFQPTNITQPERIIESLETSAGRHAFIVFEDRKSYLGKTLIFKLHNETRAKIILASLDNKKLVKNLEQRLSEKVAGPCIVHLTTDKVDMFRINNTLDQKLYINKIREIIGLEKLSVKKVTAVTKGSISRIVPVKITESRLSIIDLRNAISYSFSHEIAIHPLIKNEKMEALKAFISVLNSYFPGNIAERALILKVNQWVQSKQEITSNQWLEIIKSSKGKKNVLYDLTEWATCKGTEPQFRGYPCGLWMTFHFIVMQDYIINRNSKQLKSVDVLQAIHGYVKYFFGCRECSNHFQQMANATMMSKVKQGEDAVMWLWNAHNKVNKRLAGTATEDPYYPKVPFPPRSMCQECRYKINQSQETWNKKVVLKFLMKFYSKESIDAQINSTSIIYAVNRIPFKLTEMFSFFDLGICLFLYQFMFFLVCAFYVMFICKRRRSKKKAKKNFKDMHMV